MMKKELEKYKNHGNFKFSSNDILSMVCNAPKTTGGVYLIYDVSKPNNLIYIGSSGWVNQDGTFSIRRGGMFDRLVNGKQSFTIKSIETNDIRKNIWPLKMKEDKINQLKVEWFITFENKNRDIPAFIEALLIQKYFEKCRKLPIWNKDF